ncbi:MAG: TonB-dependent receptor [Puniceicoccaceae bacterium]
MGSTAYGQDDQLEELEAVTVTGSLIPQTVTALEAGALPVTIIGREEIEARGFNNAAELLQNMTVANGGAVPIANNATGFTAAASSVSLRGLGSDATLVLINGRRVAPYPIGTGGTTAFVDLNSIPVSAIERIEVLKDGASATYGADAVAGVVNIHLRSDFDGAELTVGYGNTTTYDSSETIMNFITGISTEDTRISFGISYYNRKSIFAGDRKFSEIPPFLSTNSSPWNLAVTRAAAVEALENAGATQAQIDAALADVEGEDAFFAATVEENADWFWGTGLGPILGNNGELPATSYLFAAGRPARFNFNETAGAYPDRQQKGAFASWERDVGENLVLYGDFLYQNTFTQNELAPSATGNFANPGGVSIIVPARTATPIVGTSGERLAVAGAYNPFNPFNEDLSGGTRARLAEFGNRIYREDTDAGMATFGFKLKSIAGSNWSFDNSFTYSYIDTTSRDSLVSISALNRLLNADDSFFDPGSGDYLGTSQPLNPFGFYQNVIDNNVAIADAAKVQLKNKNESEMLFYKAILSNPNVFEIPTGEVAIAVGYEWREESVNQSPDEAGKSGDVIGSSTANVTVASDIVQSVYTEVQVPILGKDTDVKMDLNLALRYETFDFSDEEALVPKVGVRILPVDDLVIRASWGEGFREPSLYERFAGGLTYSLTPVINQWNGVNEPEQDIAYASNPQLAPEETESFNVGFVWSPSDDKLNGLTLAVDLWRIERSGTVTLDLQDVVNRAYSAIPDSAPIIADDGVIDSSDTNLLLPGESVTFLDNGNLELVNGVFRNLGKTKISGIDIAVSYITKLTEESTIEVGAAFTYIDSYKIQQFPGAPFFEYIGEDTGILFNNDFDESQPATETDGDSIFGGDNPIALSPGSADGGYMQWKGQAYVQYASNGLNVRFSGRYRDGFRDFDYDPDFNVIEYETNDTWVFDLQVNYDLDGENPWIPGWLDNTSVTVGARNLFDKDPPKSSGLWQNASGYPGFDYSGEGRFLYASVTTKF